MVAEEEALVGGVYDDGVLRKTLLVEVVQHPADAIINRRDTPEVVLDVALVFPAFQFRLREALRWRDLEVLLIQVAVHAHLGRRCCRATVRVVVMECRRLGYHHVFVHLRVLLIRLPAPVRCLVVTQQAERPLLITPPQPFQRVVRNQVRDIALAHRSLSHIDELRIVIEPLARQDVPVIEAGRVADASVPQMPLADDSRLVARVLEQLGECRLPPVEWLAEVLDTVDMAVGAGENRGSAGRAYRIRAEAVVEAHAPCGYAVNVWCLVDAASIRADCMSRMVVTHNEDDVGFAHCTFAP